MPEITNRNRKIPKFIKKLIEILEAHESLSQDPSNQQLITWLPSINGFKILNASRFVDEVLPRYFKHKNMASFVRQLNMYGFSRPKESDQQTYFHPRFIKGNLNSMRQIQRSNHQNAPASVGEVEEVSQSRHMEEDPEIEQDVSLSSACQKLLSENQKLKQQNSQLSLKLFQLYRVQQILSHLMNPVKMEEPDRKFNEIQYSSANSEQTAVEKVEEKPLMHSFIFGENHDDWQSRLSYLSLLGGVNQGTFSSMGAQ